MAMDSESRANRIINIVIAAGFVLMLSCMVAAPRDGPNSYLDEWLKRGLPLLAIGWVMIAIGAPKYIRGKKS
ncbi:MAG: hypothetical protein ABIO43_02585 [Sphingomicrobium sp.]